jgi:hypothetical protein
MQCDAARVLMFEALDGADAGQLERHVRHCSVCRGEWEALRAVDGLLRRQGLVEPPGHFASRAMAFIDAHARRRPTWQLGLMAVGAVVTGTVLTCLAAVALLGGGLSVMAGLGLVPHPAGALRAAAVAVGVLAGAVRVGVIASAAYSLLAVLAAIAWFGALVAPRHSPSAETVRNQGR